MKAKIKKLLDNCTAGLIGDPELQLDIQAELKSHIEERIEEEKANGADDEKSLETALKAFGEAPEIADSIVSANKKRMNLRAKIRLAAIYLVIPLSIIAVLLSLDYGSFASLNEIQKFTGDRQLQPLLNSLSKISKLTYGLFNGGKQYTDEENLILNGDPNLDGAAREKAIWDKFPEDKACMGNYYTYLIQEMAGVPIDSEKGKKYISEFRKAEKIDPDNARYNYALAYYYCSAGCEIDYPKDKNGIFKTEEKGTLKIKDRKLLDQGMSELKKGLAKDYLKSCSAEMLKKRLEIMGKPENLTQHIKQVNVAAGVLLPGLSRYRHLARIAPLYAEIMINENKPEEALAYLKSWKILGTQINDESWTLIEILVAAAIFDVSKNHIEELYKKSGHPELAEKYIREQALLSEPLKKWRSRRKSDEQKDFNRQLGKRAGILTSMLMPAIGEKIDVAELEANRTLDYILMEKIVLSLICLVLLCLMIACLVSMLRGKFSRSGGGSILLIPNLTQIANIFLFSVIIPIVFYYIASRLPFIGGRGFNVQFNSVKSAIQLSCLFLALIIIPIELTTVYVRKRFRSLEIPAPVKTYNMVRLFYKIIFAVLLILCISPAFIFHQSVAFNSFIIFLLGLVAIIVIGNLMLRFFKSIFSKAEYSCYYSSIARTLIPVFAGTIIILVAISKPYVTTQETYLVQNDPLMGIDNETPGFTAVEGRLVKKLQQEIKSAEKKCEIRK